MWIFLAEHPWWGLVYLLIVCVTAIFCAMGIGAMMGAKRKMHLEGYTGQRVKSDKDVIH